MGRSRPTAARRVASGAAELISDVDCPGGWQLFVDEIPQSYVDLEDPTHLEFDYVRRIGDVLDAIAEPGVPLRVVHVGGAALTLPRYVAATRPRSRQLVIETDEALVTLVRERLPWRRGDGIRVRIGDGRAQLATLPDASADALVVDAFVGGRVPGHLTTAEAARDAARVLGPGGTYLLNIADGAPLGYAHRVLVVALATWRDVVLVGDAAVLRGRRFGNLVVAASQSPLPVASLRRRAAGAAFPARVMDRGALLRLVGTAAISTDADQAVSPAAPPELWRLGNR